VEALDDAVVDWNQTVLEEAAERLFVVGEVPDGFTELRLGRRGHELDHLRDVVADTCALGPAPWARPVWLGHRDRIVDAGQMCRRWLAQRRLALALGVALALRAGLGRHS
jgi:hypothetical protein